MGICQFCLKRQAAMRRRCARCYVYLRALDNGSDADRAYRQQLVDRATEYSIARQIGRGYRHAA